MASLVEPNVRKLDSENQTPAEDRAGSALGPRIHVRQGSLWLQARCSSTFQTRFTLALLLRRFSEISMRVLIAVIPEQFVNVRNIQIFRAFWRDREIFEA